MCTLLLPLVWLKSHLGEKKKLLVLIYSYTFIFLIAGNKTKDP